MSHWTLYFPPHICLFTHHHGPIIHPISYVNHGPHTCPLIILINHATPTNLPYQPPTFCVNVKSQSDPLPTPLIMHMQDLSLLTLYQPLQLLMIKPPNLPPSPQHIHNLHLKPLTSHLWELVYHSKANSSPNILIRHPINLVETPMTIPPQYPPLLPPRLHQLGLGF